MLCRRRRRPDAQGNVVSTDYNALGQVIKVTEPARATAKNGVVDPFANADVIAPPTTTLLLNAFGQQIREIRAAGTDSAGNVQAGLGQITRTRYDAAGHEIQEIDAAGSAQNYKVDVAGRRIEETRQIDVTMSAWITVFGVPMAMNHTTRRTFEYDALGQQIATEDWYTVGWDTKVSARESALYNRFGEVTRKQVNGGTVEIFNYDQVGRLGSYGNATNVTAFQYDLSEKVSKSTVLGDWSITTDDRITYMRNDVLGRTFEQHLPAFEANLGADTLNSATLTLSTPIIRQTLDRWGNVLSRTDARGYVTSYTYNHANQVLTETLPLTNNLRENGTSYSANPIHEKRYDALGRLIQEVDLVGPYAGVATNTLLRTRQHVYNQAGQLTRDVDALGNSRQYRYDANGNRVATQDALGTVLVDGYDAMDRQINHGIIRGGAKVTLLTNKYDQAGRLYAEISGTAETAETLKNVEDGRQGASYMSGVAGNTRYTVYNERGNITHSNNESGVMFSYEYDALNRKTLEQDEMGSTKTWTYSAGDVSRLVGHKDWGGHTYTYTYNAFGEVAKEQVGDGPDKTYHYFANGLTKFVIEGPNENWAVTGSEYDLAGNKVREFNSTIMATGSSAGGASYETFYRYDALGRLTGVRTPAGTQHVGPRDMLSTTARIDALTYSYDGLGNRRRVVLDTTNQVGVRTVIDNWFKYDLEGRVLVEDGFLNSGGQVAAGVVGGKAKGKVYTYDATGKRISSEEYVKTIDFFGYPSHEYVLNNYTYNDLGSLLTTTKRASIRNLSTNPDTSYGALLGEASQIFSAQYDARNNRISQEDVNGSERTRTTYTYRGDGQLNNQLVTRWNGSSWTASQYTFFNETRKIGVDGVERDSLVGYDAAGRSYHYRYTVYDQNGNAAMWGENLITYTGFESWKELIVSATVNSGTNGKTTMAYSARGELLMAYATGKTPFVRQFAADRNGQLTMRTEGNNASSQRYVLHNGNVLASIGNNSTPELFDTIATISPTEIDRAPGSYVIVDGDTLQTVAQKTWGDSSMWYLIADANGLSANDPLERGTSLVIPNVAGSSSNNADTFKAYDQSEVTGDLTPVPIYKPPKPKKKKSKGLASVVMVVVAVVATVFTAGAALAAIAPAAAAGFTVAGAGVAALSGAAGWAGFGAAIVGGMAGSAAAQLAGNAMGVTEGFSWGQVAMGGLAAGIGAGVGNLVSGGQTAQQLAQTGSYGKVATAAVLNSFGNYGASKIVGLDTSFSWRSIATSALASVATARISKGVGLTTDNFKSNFMNGVIGAQVSSSVQALIGKGGKLDYADVAADAFGNAIGNGLIEASLPDGNFSGPRSGDSERQKIVNGAFQRREQVRYTEQNSDIPSNDFSASLATNQFQEMLDSGQLPDTLTSAELTHLAREAEKNGGILPDNLRRAVFDVAEPLFSAGVYADTDLMGTNPTRFDTGNAARDMAYGLNSVIHNGVALGVNAIWAGANAIPIGWAELSGRTFEQANQDLLATAMALPGGAFAGRLLAPSSWLSSRVDFALSRVVQSKTLSNSRFSDLSDFSLIDDVPVLDVADNVLIKGAAFRHRTQWALNAVGARSPDEAMDLAERYGVYIADDVKINFLDDAIYERSFDGYGDSFASYGHISVVNMNQQVTFKSALTNKDGNVDIFVRRSVLDSDEAIVAVLHHETHEVEALRDVFSKKVSVSAREYSRLINDSTPGNLHWEAVDIGDQAVWQLRRDRGL